MSATLLASACSDISHPVRLSTPRWHPGRVHPTLDALVPGRTPTTGADAFVRRGCSEPAPDALVPTPDAGRSDTADQTLSNRADLISAATR